ncbi:MAG: DUF3990 domain-containing protein, partial [Spirochaetaceae bacterium]|nr:DUF3990 domain-containing protein [Spirochaetaceae bacterium]
IYHGNNTIVENPRLIAHNRFLDFGNGFYTTPNKDQAVKFAQIVAQRRGGTGMVSMYEYDDISAASDLEILHFTGADIAWLEFISQNRRGIYNEKKYDILSGPVANDNVYETVNFYSMGIFSAAEAVERLKAWELYDQITFCTERALGEIRFSGFLEI